MPTLIAQNETVNNLLNDLLLSDYTPSTNFLALVAAASRYIKDLKINVGNVLQNNQHIQKKEAYLLALSVAINEEYIPLQKSFTTLAKQEGATEQDIAEVVACTSLMNTNNVYYRFRHFVNKDYYATQPAGIKMTIMSSPILGKEFFELTSLVVSALNGCASCVVTHEQSVIQHGSSEARILEAIKLGAVIKGLTTVLK